MHCFHFTFCFNLHFTFFASFQCFSYHIDYQHILCKRRNERFQFPISNSFRNSCATFFKWQISSWSVYRVFKRNNSILLVRVSVQSIKLKCELKSVCSGDTQKKTILIHETHLFLSLLFFLPLSFRFVVLLLTLNRICSIGVTENCMNWPLNLFTDNRRAPGDERKKDRNNIQLQHSQCHIEPSLPLTMALCKCSIKFV